MSVRVGFSLLFAAAYAYAQSSKPATNPAALPKKPAGSSASLAQHFTSTAGQNYDFFSGISYKQLDIVKTQWAIVKQRAAQAINLDVSQGAGVFGKETDFIKSLWFPTDSKRLGLPAFETNSDHGGLGTRNITSDFWLSNKADRSGKRFGRTVGSLLDHLLARDTVGYQRVADDHAYWVYLLAQVNSKSSVDPISIYLHDTIQLSTAVNIFLGSDFTPEIQSAFQTVFRFMNWHLSVIVDLYTKKVYQRYEGQTGADSDISSACNEISPSDLIPAEEDYEFMSNGTMAYTYGSNGKTGPVSPEGRPLPDEKLGRADDYSGASSGSNQGSGSNTGSGTGASASGLAPQPQPSPGAPSLTPFPYSATANKPTDAFTGITYEQLTIGGTTWSAVKLPLPERHLWLTSMEISLLPNKPTTQSAHRMVQRHPEFLPAFNITNVEEIWTSTTFDARIRTPFARTLDNCIVGITLRNYGLFVRSIDRAQFQHYVDTRELGQAWYTLSYYTWLTDAHLSAAEFFLGSSLTDEQYSALESVFSFSNLKAYQVYHTYNKFQGYRDRPFASDFEMIGTLTALG